MGYLCTFCTRIAALLLALAILGWVAAWYDDGAVGLTAIIALGCGGVAFAVSAHHLSKRGPFKPSC